MEKKLCVATECGEEEEVRKILKGNKDINVNWQNEYRSTALHVACNNGRDKIVTMLLAHPDIDVNLKNNGKYTPFLLACARGRTNCVRLLLKDVRVKVNEPRNDEATPLWFAAIYGHLQIIKWWIASGREMDLGETGNENNDAIGAAKESGHDEVVSLLEKFRDHQTQTRHTVRTELECFDELAAELFAVVIFLSDGLFELGEKNTNGATRFLGITERLPMDLQMLLCYCVMGSTKMNIPGEQRELAFKKLAKDLLN
jgi:hypothetical protein